MARSRSSWPDGATRTFLEDGDEVVLRGEPLGEVVAGSSRPRFPADQAISPR